MTALPALALGPFQLQSTLGRGGMGQVWRALHEAQSVPVAIKVMTVERARQASYQEAFVGEVRAVARLQHPGIITVFDHGEVSEEAAARAGGQLVAGSPYLVMELAPHGTLRALEPVRSYAAMRGILLELLDALAHAHARGVVHRDIKPGNVLVGEDADGQPRIKLSDFGIAHAAEHAPIAGPPSGSATGTPGFMAVEQILGDAQKQGPWTDIYALGCVAYRLACGHAPFSPPGADIDEVLYAHVNAAVPKLSGRVTVPEGFQQWVERMLHKAPFERYQRCADAALALLELGDGNASDGDAEQAPWTAAIPEVRRLPPSEISTLWKPAAPVTLATREASFPLGQEPTTELFEDRPSEEIADETTIDWGPLLDGGPPIPESWQSPVSQRPPRRMLGVGLGLYGLRPVPLVGRRQERDAIWQALLSVRYAVRSRVLLLRGSAGVGKSCLAEWMGQRAHELGCATVVTATHSPIQGPTDGLRHMLARQLRCIGLGQQAMLSQVRDVLREELHERDAAYQAMALTELIGSPLVSQDGQGAAEHETICFSSWAERYAVVYRLLSRLCTRRPLILWLDDVQWGAGAIGLAQHVLQARRQLPVLLLLTLREDALAERALESLLLERLMASPHTESLPIEPLDSADHRALVRELLGLEGELTQQVCDRTDGNPLFAVQLIGDWVQRGVLEVGPQGFRLRPGERAELPDDIHELWRARIVRLESCFSGKPVRQALEIAAALGGEVDLDEWSEACALAGIDPPADLVEVMATRGLARGGELGWAFAHGMLVESLKKGAEAANRWRGHHRACGQMVVGRHGGDGAAAERLARHLLAAGDLDRALVPLLKAAEQRLTAGDFDRARALTDSYEATLTALAAAPQDARWSAGWMVAARASIDLGDLDRAGSLLERAARTVCERPSQLSASILRWQALWARHKAEVGRALELAERARAEFEQIGDMLGLSDCLSQLADCHLEATGDHEAARGLLAIAQQHYRRIGDRDRMALCDYRMSKLQVELEMLDEAEKSVLAAMQHYEQRQSRWGIASCNNQLGEIARLRGELAQARSYYQRAIELLDAMGSNVICAPWLNIALMMVQGGDYAEALPVVTDLRAEFESAGQLLTLGYLDYARLTCLAHQQQWCDWEQQLERVGQWRPATNRVDKDLAMLAQQAGDLARGAGEPARALQAYVLALEHWTALGKADRVSEVEQLMAACQR